MEYDNSFWLELSYRFDDRVSVFTVFFSYQFFMLKITYVNLGIQYSRATMSYVDLTEFILTNNSSSLLVNLL